MGSRHCSMDPSAPTILRPPGSNPKQNIKLYLNCDVKRAKIIQKEAGIGPFKNCNIKASFVHFNAR